MTIVHNNYMHLWMIQNYKNKLKPHKKEGIMNLDIIMILKVALEIPINHFEVQRDQLDDHVLILNSIEK